MQEMPMLASAFRVAVCHLLFCVSPISFAGDEPASLTIRWEKETLLIDGPPVEGANLSINYIEAYCRPGSTARGWNETVIPHETELVSASGDGRRIELRSTLSDGVVVTHTITAHPDEIDFQLVATNPTDQASEAHWGQPCVRVGGFTGRNQETYLDKCFIFLEGELERFPTAEWATEALYTPGQVWGAKGVNRDDLNPRPLNPLTPSNGLIGCFSADESKVLAIAFDPWQELFQGVFACLHADFRIGGLEPGDTKRVHGKLYIVENDIPALFERYERDFPEQADRTE
jgi:hypothetical protein